MHSYLWFLLVNHSNPSTHLEKKKGQQNLNQDLKCLVTVEKQRTLIPPGNFSNNWALGVSAKHFPGATCYSLMQTPELLPCLCVGCLSICTWLGFLTDWKSAIAKLMGPTDGLVKPKYFLSLRLPTNPTKAVCDICSCRWDSFQWLLYFHCRHQSLLCCHM